MTIESHVIHEKTGDNRRPRTAGSPDAGPERGADDRWVEHGAEAESPVNETEGRYRNEGRRPFAGAVGGEQFEVKSVKDNFFDELSDSFPAFGNNSFKLVRCSSDALP